MTGTPAAVPVDDDDQVLAMTWRHVCESKLRLCLLSIRTLDEFGYRCGTVQSLHCYEECSS